MPTTLRQCPECDKHVFVLTAKKCIHCGEELPESLLPSANEVDALLEDDPTGVGERIREKKMRKINWPPEGYCGGGGDGGD